MGYQRKSEKKTFIGRDNPDDGVLEYQINFIIVYAVVLI